MRPRALLTICRVSNLPTVWMNVLTAGVLARPEVPVASLPLLAVALSAFYSGGMTLNDLCDRHADAREQPFRPIPAGRVTVGEAWTATVVLFACGLLLLLLAPHPGAFGWGVLLLAVIVAYDVWHKGNPVSVLLMAGARLLVFVVTGWAVSGTVEQNVLMAGAAQFSYTLAVTVVARHENTRGRRYEFPVIPIMIAAMAILDGVVLAVLISPRWLLAGLVAATLTRLGQQYVRGD